VEPATRKRGYVFLGTPDIGSWRGRTEPAGFADPAALTGGERPRFLTAADEEQV